MSRKTNWSDSFRDRLRNLKETLNIKESFENKTKKRKEEDEIENMEDEEEEEDNSEKQLSKKIKEERKKKKEKAEKEKEKDNYKSRELMENLKDKDRIPNMQIKKLNKIVKSFSSLHDKFEELVDKKKRENDFIIEEGFEEDDDDHSDKEGFEEDDDENEEKEGFDEDDDDNDRSDKEGFEEDDDDNDDKEGFDEDDDDDDKEGFDEDDDDNDDKEGFDEDDEDDDKEGFDEDDEDDDDKEGFVEGNRNKKKKKGKKKNPISKKNTKFKNPFKKSKKQFQDSFFALYADIKKLNNLIPEGISYALSFGQKITTREKKFMKETWFHLTAFFITFYVFLNWFYVIYFESLTTHLIESDIYYPYFKFSKNIPETGGIINFFLNVPCTVLDTLKDTSLYLLKTLPLDWGIGLEVVIPLFFYLMYRVSYNVNINILSYIKNLLKGKGDIITYLMGAIMILVVIYCLAKASWVALEKTLKGGQPISTAIYTIVYFIIKLLVSIPISILFIAWFYVYYSFFVIIIQPIEELGVLGTFSEIFNKLQNFNPIFLKSIQDENCVPLSHKSVLGFLKNQLVVPTLVFIVRHFLSYFFVLFLLFTLIRVFYFVNTFTLKMNLIGIIGVIISAIILMSKWATSMTIGFPTSSDINENLQINMGYSPFIGSMAVLIFTLYYSNYKLLTKTIRIVLQGLLFLILLIHFIYMIRRNDNIDLGYLPTVLMFMMISAVVGMFYYDTFFNTTIGRVVTGLVILFAIISLR